MPGGVGMVAGLVVRPLDHDSPGPCPYSAVLNHNGSVVPGKRGRTHIHTRGAGLHVKPVQNHAGAAPGDIDLSMLPWGALEAEAAQGEVAHTSYPDRLGLAGWQGEGGLGGRLQDDSAMP